MPTSRQIMRILCLPGAIGALVVVVGCATPPSAPPPAVLDMDVPPSWQEVAGEADRSLDGWLADFGSPALTALVDEALRANPDLQQTAERIRSARAQLAVSHSARLPAMDLAGRGNRSRSVGGEWGSTYDLGLTLDWEWDLWGRLALRDASAYGQLEAAEATYRGARLSLASQVCSAWLIAIRDHLQLRQARHTLTNFETSQGVIESRYEAAQTTALDVRLGRATLAQARAEVQAAERTARESVRALEILLGRYPSGRAELPADLPALRYASVPAGLPAELVRRRPDLAVAERQLAAAEADLAAERLNKLPSVRLTAEGGHVSSHLQQLLDLDHLVATLAANLAMPILDGGRLDAQQEQADAERAVAQAAYVSAALAAFQDVENALTNETILVAELDELDDARRQYESAEDLAREQYGEGLVDITTLLDAQRRSVDARSRVIDARSRRLLNRVQLYAALGGDFQTDPSP